MKMKRLFFIMAGFCIASFSLVHAELLIIKREGGIDSPSRFVPLDKDDIAKHGKAISDVLLSYAWPMCISKLSFEQKTVADQEQKDLDELLSPDKKYAEELFIQKKLQALPGLSNYHVIYIPTCLYELFSITQIFSNPEQQNIFQAKIDALCAIRINIIRVSATIVNPLRIKFSLKKTLASDTISDVQARMYRTYDAANDNFFLLCKDESPALFINSALIKMLFDKYGELESSPDALTLSNILKKKCVDEKKCADLASHFVKALKDLHSKSGKGGLCMPHALASNDFFINDLVSRCKTDDGRQILAKIVALEYEARELNKALLLRGTNYQKTAMGLGKNPEKKMLAGSTLYTPSSSDWRTNAEIPFPFEATYQKKQYTPYSMSFGNSLFAGALLDPYACAFNFLMGERAAGGLFAPSFKAVGYALLVDKKSYLDNKCGNLFFISPLAPLTALMGQGEFFHSRTTAAIVKKSKKTDGTLQLMTVAGIAEGIADPYGFLFITRDPLKHAELFSKFLAENGRFIQSGDEEALTAEEKEFVANVKKSQEEAANFYHTARRKLTPSIQKASEATFQRAVETFKNKKTDHEQTAQAAAQ